MKLGATDFVKTFDGALVKVLIAALVRSLRFQKKMRLAKNSCPGCLAQSARVASIERPVNGQTNKEIARESI